MIKKILLVLLFQSFIYACALCSVYQPTIEPKVVFQADKNTLTKADITWKFTPEFSAELSRDYDKNANNSFEKDEVKAIERAIIEYIQPLDFLTTIKINPHNSDTTIDEIKPLRIKNPTYQTYFVDDLLHFSYQIDIDTTLNVQDVLFLTVHDEAGYFIFKFNSSDVSFKDIMINPVINTRANALFVEFKDTQKPTQEQTVTPKTDTAQVVEVQKEQSYLSRILENISQKLQSLLKQIKEQNSIVALFLVLVFSLLYGAVHAAGPGHGKTVVASYIFSSNKDVKKALIISLLIGLVHAFSAFILTLVIYFLVTGFLMPFVDKVEVFVTKLSAVVIIAIALYLLYKKISISINNKKRPKFSIHKPSCGCASCQVESSTTDLGVILSAGLVPCPGTVIIFIVTISQQMLLVGFLSALFMSLGMSIVIFLTALFSLSVKKQLKNQTLITFFEYFSLAVIVSIGVLILLV